MEELKQGKLMKADIKGALRQIDRSYLSFEHKGRPMTKHNVRRVLEYGLRKGYVTTDELSDEEVDKVLQGKLS